MIAAVRESRQRTLETRSLVQASLNASKTSASASSSVASSRTVSPAPSNSSESSTSTHTATPRTPHPEQKKGKGKGKAGNGVLNGLTYLTPSTPPSPSEDSAATARTITPDIINKKRANGLRNGTKSRQGTPTPDSPIHSNVVSPVPHPPRSSSISPPAVRPPTTVALIRSYIQTVIRNASKTKLTALFLLFVVFPFVSFFLRMQRRRMVTSSGGTANQVRRRLRGIEGSATTTGLVVSLWGEIARAIGDTIRMGGGGLA